MVNRIWQQHFGVGLVETPNDFGIQGAAPSHPELLDWLAEEFIASGWSVKAMHRLMLTSRAYQCASAASDAARERDPANKLLAHLPVRRLEAESVRDAILAVAGSLDETLFGEGIAPHLTPFMTSRYRPEGGPLDGANRRSIYLTVRRNFLNSMLLAFDFPNPSEPNGRRSVSNVPTQALALLNNEFTHELARRWAAREFADTAPARERVARMFTRALGRPPEETERDELLGLAAAAPDDAGAWADLAHVLFNTKSFIFIR